MNNDKMLMDFINSVEALDIFTINNTDHTIQTVSLYEAIVIRAIELFEDNIFKGNDLSDISDTVKNLFYPPQNQSLSSKDIFFLINLSNEQRKTCYTVMLYIVTCSWYDEIPDMLKCLSLLYKSKPWEPLKFPTLLNLN